MLFKIGDFVTRKSYNNDMVFKVVGIKDSVAILNGVNVRLIADANLDDLVYCDSCFDDLIREDNSICDKMSNDFELDRSNYFYLPGRILHIDSDEGYLSRCLNLYKNMNIVCRGIVCSENKVYINLKKYLNDFKPNVVVITGHDAFYDNEKDFDDNSNYKNSASFIKAVIEARDYEKDPEKLIIIAGACQSNYEEIIKAGANFASSPKRVNIHALDPAIIAVSLCFSSKNKPIDLIKILNKTKCGNDGIGGIITNGVMYVGFPR